MMKTFSYFASLLALAGMAAPAAAQQRIAAYETSAVSSQARPFLFSGATVRLELNGKSARKPEVALRMAGGTRTEGFVPRIGEGIAFSAVPGVKPRLTLAGQDSRAVDKRLNMSGGTTALVIGGVVVAALVVAVAASGASDAPAAFWDDE